MSLAKLQPHLLFKMGSSSHLKQGESSFGVKTVFEIEWKFSKSKPKLLDCVDENQHSLALCNQNPSPLTGLCR